MRRIKIIITIVFATLSLAAFSQSTQSNKSAYLELGGSGILASLNYEQAVWTKNSHTLLLRGGAGYFPLILNTDLKAGTFSIIVGAKYNKRFQNHVIGFGISNNIASTFSIGGSENFSSAKYGHLIVPDIGYRYQPTAQYKLFAGIGYSPVISYDGFTIENKAFQFKNHFYVSLGLNL